MSAHEQINEMNKKLFLLNVLLIILDEMKAKKYETKNKLEKILKR